MFKNIIHFQHGPVSSNAILFTLRMIDYFRSIAMGKFLKFEVNSFFGTSGGLQFFNFDTAPIEGVKRREITINIVFQKVVITNY